MPDHEDDWMDPKPASYQRAEPENKMVYAIERAKKEICFGIPGYSIKWLEWERYDTAKERDEALERLETEHPAWRLRPHDYNPYFERHFPHLGRFSAGSPPATPVPGGILIGDE